ncbi:hypothetical protein A2839_00790 [Candidatus Uhrbacteria bacterium RIFCSPHIGHO2_01_FULL_47_10]|nr:MAG: hypothetical protein A2839_00790 [Candidatus Uhrbacteria bacterium RIFCSPHIGHO2_01_FULL_47_10]
MSSSYPRLMSVDGLSIGVNLPYRQMHGGLGLAAFAPHMVHNVADFKESPQGWPRAVGEKEASYFTGVMDDREMWFDFKAMNQHPHFVAIAVIVQRVNAVSGRKAEHVYLEQYKTTCPNHDIAFESERYCPECKFKWPAQNYVTNVVGGGEFWLDGWRSQDGEIRQFVFADVEAGLGVAQQLIGEERTADIRFAVFLSKNPKPVSPRMDVLRRGIGSPIVTAHQQHYGTLGGHDLESFGSQTKGGFEVHTMLYNSPAVAMGTRSMDPASVTLGGGEERGIPFCDDLAESVGTMRRIGAPVKQEVSFGRAVDQKIHADPNDIDFWQSEPAAVIMLTPAPADWVATVTRNGATVDRTKGGMGPLAGIKGVG